MLYRERQVTIRPGCPVLPILYFFFKTFLTGAVYSRQNAGSNAYTDAFRQQVLAAYHERCSLRGVCRIFGISRQTLVTWLKKSRSTSTSGEDTCPA